MVLDLRLLPNRLLGRRARALRIGHHAEPPTHQILLPTPRAVRRVRNVPPGSPKQSRIRATTTSGTCSSQGKYPKRWKDFNAITSPSRCSSERLLSLAHSISSGAGSTHPAPGRSLPARNADKPSARSSHRTTSRTRPASLPSRTIPRLLPRASGFPCRRLMLSVTVTPSWSRCDSQFAVSGSRSPKWILNASSAVVQFRQRVHCGVAFRTAR